MEEERQRLNAMGNEAFSLSSALSEDQELQKQSQKVDELILRYQITKAKQREIKSSGMMSSP
ncbi:hypothetical protein PA598K_07145 [Paenibacillus sp. 598K]|nr:hypothetical protein PA598K_07145 [Paenibacillus sp. 598K]